MRRLLLALFLLAWLPATASAFVDTNIDFQAIPHNTAINTQYASSGVNFGTAQSFGFPAPPNNYQCTPFGDTNGIAGTSAMIACRRGPNEFPERFFGTAFELDYEQRQVSFRISSRVAFQSGPINADIRAYGIGGNLIEAKNVSLPAGANVQVDFIQGSQVIAGIVITGALGESNSGSVLIDDIFTRRDDVPASPKFTLALATPSIDVVEGATGDATVSVRRYNGSSGPVNLTVGSPLPAGIAATQFEPNPTSGRDPVALRITADSPFSGQAQLTVDATSGGGAGTKIGGALLQTVSGLPAVQIPEGGRFPIRLVPGCGQQEIQDGFTVRGGFRNPVRWGAENPTGGLSATESTIPIAFPSGDGLYPVKFKLDPGPNDGGGSFEFQTRPDDGTPQTLKINWITDRVRVDQAPTSIARPIIAGRGTIGLTGNFPTTNCALKFVDNAGQEWPIKSRDFVDFNGRQRDRIFLDMPITAASGPLKVLGANGAELARVNVDVTDFRSVFALSLANSGAGATAASYTWEDFVRTFGEDDTEDCFIVCVRDALAKQYYTQIRTRVTAGGGLCGGWSIMALRFRGFNGLQQRASDYQPGETRPWRITPLTDGTAVKRDVIRWQTSQSDKAYADERTRALARTPAEERSILKELIARHGGAYIGVTQSTDGSGGHAVVGYGVQDTANGGVQVDVYDPNIPYSTAEDTNSALRTSNLNTSRITIGPDGSWSGTSLTWSGTNSQLGVFTVLPSENAELPSNANVFQSLFSSSGDQPPATVAQIDADGQPALNGNGAPRPGSGVTNDSLPAGPTALPMYGLASGKEYTISVRGTGSGSYGNGALGRGSGAQVIGARTARGQEDEMKVRPGEASLEFSTGAARSPVTYELTDEVGKATRTASVVMTARKGAGDEASLSNGTLRLLHDGPATSARVTLTSTGEGIPGSVTTAPVRVGGGRRIELKPRKWSDLSAGVRLTIRNQASGRVLRRVNVRLVGTTRVAVAGVSAKRSGSRVTFSGRVTKRGSAPVLAGVVEIVRGGRVIRRRAVSRRGSQVRAGRFSLPVTIGSVPRGASLRAQVRLIDEAFGLATVKREVRVR